MLQTSSLLRNNNIHMLSAPRQASSSSRTARVYEELQENLEAIQKEVKNTKAQLEIVSESKEQSEQENEEFITSNKQLRSDIQEIMQILESKQQLLDSTKKTYISTENKVKQLKDEAMAARKELDDLKRREHTIEKECNTIKILKGKQAQQKILLDQSVAQAQADFDKELDALRLELESIKEQNEKLKSTDVTELVRAQVEKQTKERQPLIDEFNRVQKEIQSNNQQFISQIQQELQDLLATMTTSTHDDTDTEVINCKQDVDSLVARIKSNTSILL